MSGFFRCRGWEEGRLVIPAFPFLAMTARKLSLLFY